MRSHLFKILLLSCFLPNVVLAQSYFGNFGQTAQPNTPASNQTSGGTLPAPIPNVATPDQFRANVNQLGDQAQQRLSSQYQELLAKQPPLVKSPDLPPPPPTTVVTQTTTSTPTPTAVVQTPAPVVVQPAPVAPPTTVIATPPTQSEAPVATQVQIAPASAPASPAINQAIPTRNPPPAASNGNGSEIIPAGPQTQIYSGFQQPQQQNNVPTRINQNAQGQGGAGWNIKY